MKADYNMTGKDRKALVDAIAAITGEAAEYQFVPTCAYKIGNITVDKNGTMIWDESTDEATTLRISGLTELIVTGALPKVFVIHFPKPVSDFEKAFHTMKPMGKGILTFELPINAPLGGQLSAAATSSCTYRAWSFPS